MPDIVIGDNQNRVKDSYAPASVLNLTLRSNGEEIVQVMDSLGNFVYAGFVPPSVAPGLAIGAAIGLTPNKWVAYRYVYAATKRYPLVENAVTAGGDISPRSNPSPRTAIFIPAAPATGSKIQVTVTGAARVDLDKIWIYRTDYYDTQAEAEAAADAGQCFFVTAINDTGSPGTFSYTDAQVIITGNELIETDNFTPENFQLCVFDDPYFYGVGNFAFIANVNVDATGLVTLTDPWNATTNPNGDKWYDGRNGQRCTFQGITDSGFDNRGTFYFKVIDAFTAQLYLDKQLSIVGAPLSFGDTRIKIQGEPNILYRSKPRNPFAWGFVETIGEIDVPRPYAHRFGGGQATAMCLVPILNLLKIDTEGPNKTFVFNLNGKGTPAFESSKREISSDFSTSNNWCQFTAKDKMGNSYIYFFDSKFKAICQADGATNVSMSSPVFEALRNLSVDPDDRLMCHGAYEPTLELSCVWLTRAGSSLVNDIMLSYHHPTDTWSTHLQRDILCSAPFLDQETNEQFVLLGTAKGRIGRGFFAEGSDWFPPTSSTFAWPAPMLKNTNTSLKMDATYPVDMSDPTIFIGLWVNLMASGGASQFQNNTYRGSARVSDVQLSGPNWIWTFDKFRTSIESEAFDFTSLFIDFNTCTAWVFPGSTFCACCKMYADTTLAGKKLTEIWTVVDQAQNFEFHTEPIPWKYSIYGGTNIGYMFNAGMLPFSFTRDKVGEIGGPNFSNVDSNYFYIKNPLNIDLTRNVRVYLHDVGYQNSFLYSFQVTFDNA